MARKTGNHLCSFQGLLILMPMRKTTNSPSISADMREAITFATRPPPLGTPSPRTPALFLDYGSHEKSRTSDAREQFPTCRSMRAETIGDVSRRFHQLLRKRVSGTK